MVWRQAGKRTNNNLTPETRTHSSEGRGKDKKQDQKKTKNNKKCTRVKKKRKQSELLLVISRTEHIVIRLWQRDEMCEVGNRRWQEEGAHPVNTS